MDHHVKSHSALPSFIQRLFADEIRLWNGTGRLSTAFWTYGVLVSAILIVLYTTTVFLHQLLAQQLLLICFGIWTALSLVSIWRCSQATASVWGMFARFLTVAWAANVGLVLLFRQLDLLAVFIGQVPRVAGFLG